MVGAGSGGSWLLGTGTEAGTCTCGRLQVLEASFMALRMLPEKVKRPGVSAPAGGEAPSEVLSIPLLLDSSQATLGLWVSGSPG